MSVVNTPIVPPGQEKFSPPILPAFDHRDAWLSAISLLIFLASSVVAIVQSRGIPLWATGPFWFTTLGSGVGFVYEIALLLSGRPYQLLGTPRGRLIQTLRLGNLALVFGSVYLAFVLLTFGTTDVVEWMVAIVGVVTGFLLMLFLFQAPIHIGAGVLTAGLVVQIVLSLATSELQGGLVVRLLVILAAVGLYSTTIIGSQTPWRSTLFHVVATAVVGVLYLVLDREFSPANGIAHPLKIDLGFRLFAATMLGVFLAFRLVPSTWARLRSLIANATWPLFYLIIAGGMRIPRPNRLGDLYRGHEDQLRPLQLLPYYIAHPRNLSHAVSVPCLDDALTLKVHEFGYITQLVKLIFGMASVVNRVFPFADIKVPIRQKPRMEPWSDGSDYWPGWLLRKIYIPRLGWFSIESGVRGPGFQATPRRAVDAYRRGQLLAFLVEYGVAGPFVEPVQQDGRTRFQLDFRFLEKYETKPDYESYGGTAWFEVDDRDRCLRLIEVRAPHSDVILNADPSDAAFRHAEDLILASISFYVVSGKHLVEIHMGLNLVEVALFNSFDAKREWFHPVRLALYPHLFAHELAEELTTQNLLEDEAVFTQIFATTNASLMRHLNDRFHEYQLARDEDFELREQTLLSGRAGSKLEDVLPRSSLVWEKEYAAIWQEYSNQLVNAAFADDAAVARDGCVQALFANLSQMYKKELPKRYDEFHTRSGLARFISDTMHHLIIRHEVYGTSGVRLSLDPRISKVQVPKDGGTYSVDEWRSLACIAMATSRVRYAKLMTDYTNTFDDLRDEPTKARFKDAFASMQAQLKSLEQKYRGDGVDNYECLRLLPSDLDIGAGY